MLTVIMLTVIMLTVVMLNVIMLNIMASTKLVRLPLGTHPSLFQYLWVKLKLTIKNIRQIRKACQGEIL